MALGWSFAAEQNPVFRIRFFYQIGLYLQFQIRKALKEQRDVNLQLRSYIDGILMNIIEQHPELLEVRRK